MGFQDEKATTGDNMKIMSLLRNAGIDTTTITGEQASKLIEMFDGALKSHVDKEVEARANETFEKVLATKPELTTKEKVLEQIEADKTMEATIKETYTKNGGQEKYFGHFMKNVDKAKLGEKDYLETTIKQTKENQEFDFMFAEPKSTLGTPNIGTTPTPNDGGQPKAQVMDL